MTGTDVLMAMLRSAAALKAETLANAAKLAQPPANRLSHPFY